MPIGFRKYSAPFSQFSQQLFPPHKSTPFKFMRKWDLSDFKEACFTKVETLLSRQIQDCDKRKENRDALFLFLIFHCINVHPKCSPPRQMNIGNNAPDPNQVSTFGRRPDSTLVVITIFTGLFYQAHLTLPHVTVKSLQVYVFSLRRGILLKNTFYTWPLRMIMIVATVYSTNCTHRDVGHQRWVKRR